MVKVSFEPAGLGSRLLIIGVLAAHLVPLEIGEGEYLISYSLAVPLSPLSPGATHLSSTEYGVTPATIRSSTAAGGMLSRTVKLPPSVPSAWTGRLDAS